MGIKAIIFIFTIFVSFLIKYLCSVQFSPSIEPIINDGVTIEDLLNLIPDVELCNSKNVIFMENKSYSYSYEASVQNWHDVKLQSKLNCDLVLNTFGKCRYLLYTHNCKLIEGLDSVLRVKSLWIAKQMEKFPIAFSMNDDGVLYLSPFAGDRPIILNFKRGIISSFQTMLVDEFSEDSFSEETTKLGAFWPLGALCRRYCTGSET